AGSRPRGSAISSDSFGRRAARGGPRGERSGPSTLRAALTHDDQTSHAGPETATLDARLVGVLTKRGKPVGKADLLRAARVSHEERPEALERLAALEATGQLVRAPGDRYTTLARSGLVAGKLAVHPNGFAFVCPD